MKEIKQQFIWRCFNSDVADNFGITGTQANVIADWWLDKLDQAIILERKRLVSEINSMAIEHVGNSAKTVDQIISLIQPK